jgi:DNA polymerase II large subunit
MNAEEHTKIYFESIENKVNIAHDLATRCKSKGLDPTDTVEIMMARDMAERVVGLISVVCPELKESVVVDRIKELETKYGSQDWRVALTIALEVAEQKFFKFNDKIKAMEIGIRVGISYITNGVVSSPLEGFTKLEIKKRKDGGEYMALFFAGPMRSAGGTAEGVSVIIGDYIRKKMGYLPYDPTENELKRVCTELLDYHERVTNLQYLPSTDEINFMIQNIPVQIDGDPSEKIEVSNYKGLDRIETDRIRNGVCLVVGEGLTQKAPKLWKQLSSWGQEFGLEDWMFLEEFVKLQKEIKSKQNESSEENKKKLKKVEPDYTFIKDLVAGRPVFTHPIAPGGFRLRYGRARVSGLSAQAMHPATMAVLDDFIAVGTQLKVERPGKSSVIAVCDSIEGPLVKLNCGSVVKLKDYDSAINLRKDINEIIYLGDILIPYGDYFDRGHRLSPPGYCEEWWAQELFATDISKHPKELDSLYCSLKKNIFYDVSFEEALKLSNKFGVALHPKYTYYWDKVDKKNLKELKGWFEKASVLDSKIVLPLPKSPEIKRTLELLGVPHQIITNEHVVVVGEEAKAIHFCFENLDLNKSKEIFNCFPIKLKDPYGTSIGARMGRPEKAKMRKLTGSPQVLFPVGEEGGRLRSFQSSLDKGYVRNQFPIYVCECGNESIYPLCENCGKKTKKKYICAKCGLTDEICHEEMTSSYKEIDLDIGKYYTHAAKIAGINRSMLPELIKGVRGTSNKDHIPEHLAKGLLRAVNKIYVNKDGTTRYDMTEMPLTHFKPLEIGTSIEKLKELGYTHDIHGDELIDSEQILELKIQDIVLPGPTGALDESCDVVFSRVAKFIDDLLEKMYGEKRYYNVVSSKDLIGHLVVALAPHISAGAVGRIIGFSNTQSILAHPYFHCMVRRDCDGDELCCMLLIDAFLNFSRKYLPGHRGSTQDAPLVLTSLLTPNEVDDMVFNMDVCWKYPLEFYEAASEMRMPWDVKISQISERLDKPEQFFGFGYTHETTNFNSSVNCSAYKRIPTMGEKVDGQMEIARKVRAVQTEDVARLIIERHFIRDIKGNLRKFSMQQFRCIKCNTKYRRPPIVGRCTKGKCFGNIVFTISQGSIVKYLEPSLALAEKYNLPDYLKETLDLTKLRVESIFGRVDEKQEGLSKFFG